MPTYRPLTMKRFCNLLIVSLFAFAVAPVMLAQQGTDTTMTAGSESSRPADTTLRLKFGVFGNLHAGVTYGSFGKLANSFQSDPVFRNSDYQLSGLGSDFGGHLFGLLFKRIIIGGGGTYFAYDASLSLRSVPSDTSQFVAEQDQLQRGETNITSGTIHGNLGFAIINRKKLLLFPYIGYHTGTSTLTVKNYSPDVINLGSATIDRSRTEKFTSDITMFEFGVGVRVFKNRAGGLSVGAELGGYLNLGDPTWTADNGGAEVKNIEQSSLSGGYLRITVGGGIFSTTQPQPCGKRGTDAYVPEGATGAQPQEEGRRNRREEAAEDAQDRIETQPTNVAQPQEDTRRERRSRRNDQPAEQPADQPAPQN
jgi:hypothetical protein